MSFSSVCRLCLNEVTIAHSLLENDSNMWLDSLTSIKVDENDNLPRSACIKCWLNLKYAYGIQQNILEVNDRLQSLNVGNMKNLQVDDYVEEKVNLLDGSNVNLDIITALESKNLETTVSDIETSNLKVENLTDSEFTILIVKEDHINETINCQICGEKVLENNILDHVKTHFDSKQWCDECNISLQNINAYAKHVEEKHQKIQKLWTCPSCLSTFHYKPLFTLHMQKGHPGGVAANSRVEYLKKKLGIKSKAAWGSYTNEIFTCTQCPKEFSKKEKLKAHERNCHTRRKCPVCSKLICPSGYLKHVESHTAEPVVCDICGNSYKNPDCLRSHKIYTHSTREFPCEFCGKVFSKSFSKVLHVKKEHTKERNHICDECGKSFVQFYTLSKHIQTTHRKVRPHKCIFCKKKFSSAYSLKTHKRQHTNECPYLCVYCGEGFRQNVSLKCHLKSKHDVEEDKNIACKVCGKMFVDNHALKSHTVRLHWGVEDNSE